MAALDLDSNYNGKKIIPFFRFERRQEFRVNDDGIHELAYKKVPVLDEDGKPVVEEFSFPNGTTFKRPVTKDDLSQPITRVYLYIRPHGSKDEIGHDAESSLKNWEKQANSPEGQFPRFLFEALREGYRQFIDGTSVDAKGTKIQDWEGLAPQMAGHLIQNGITTVEALASANEQMLMAIGTGGRGMQNQAREWLETRKERAVGMLEEKSKTQAEEIAELKDQLKTITALLQAQALQAKVDALPTVSETIANASAADIAKSGGKPGTLHLKK